MSKNFVISVLTFLSAFIFSLVFVSAVALCQSSNHIQNSPFPNELEGYEFFGKGRLKSVVFGVTKKTDVEKIFGSSCEKDCEYDDHFVIKFDYLNCDDCMTTEYIRNRAMCPLKENMGTVEKITLTPKVQISFKDVPTSPFAKNTGGMIMSKGGSDGVSYESFSDEYGLKYSIKRSDISTMTLTSPGPAYITGPLYSIEYGFSIETETRIFKAEYETCKDHVSK